MTSLLNIYRTLSKLGLGLFLVIFLSLTCGCNTYKKYSRDKVLSPEVLAEVDELYGDARIAPTSLDKVGEFEKSPQDSSKPKTYTSHLTSSEKLAEPVLGLMNWKGFFSEPKLQNLIETGLKYNSDLQIAQLRTAEAEALLKGAKLAYLPSLNLNAQGNGARYQGNGAMTYNLALTSDWELDLFGKLTNQKRGAQKTLEASKHYSQAVRTALIATIANSYYSLVMLDQQLDIAQRTLESWTEMERSLEALKRVGAASDPAILQTRANRLELEKTIEQLQLQSQTVTNALCTTLGITPKEIQRDSVLSIDIPEDVTVGVPILLLSNRPEVQQAEAELAQAYYATNEAKAAFYPSVTLSGTLGFTNSAGDAIANPGKWLLNAIASLTQPLFARGQLKTNLEVAEARQSQAKINFRQSLLEAGRQVNDALATMQSCERRIEKGEQQIVVLSEAARKTELLMRHSSTDYLQVLTARQDLLAAQQQVLQDKFEYVEALINLFHALGGGSQD